MKRIVHIVKDIAGECLIREYLKRRLGFSTSLIAKVKYDMVFVNGTPVHMRHMVKSGDEITVFMPPEQSVGIEPIKIPLSILYEDEYILVVNKPRNMPVHPCRGNSLPTLANAVIYHISSPFVFRAVNRLDRDTSGIVIIAKDILSASTMCNAIKAQDFEKSYVAVVEGVPQPREGIIDAPIKRAREGEILRVVSSDGKPSITKYRVVNVLPDGNSICELFPVTGRTHQIRVHMAHIGHPLVNDFLYGQRSDESTTYKLHCRSISFTHPKGERITISCEPDFAIT